MSKQSPPIDARMWRVFNDFHYLCDTHRFRKLLGRAELVRMIADVPGDIVDAGTFKGISTLQFAHYLEIFRPSGSGRVVSFDTFEAVFPHARADEASSAEAHMDTLYEKSAFEQLGEAREALGLAGRIEIVRGDIMETFEAYLKKHPGFRIAMLHCDLDVYAPTKRLLELAWPRLVPGGIAVFDQYAVRNWGESDAVDEFLATLPCPPRLQMVPFTPTPTAYCVKAA